LAEKIKSTGDDLSSGIGDAGKDISAGAKMLESVLVNLKADIVDLEEVIKNATESGKDAASRLSESAGQLVRIHSALGETLGEINDAGSSIESVAGALKGSLDDFKTMQENVASRMDLAFRSASEANEALKEAGNQIGKVASELGGAWQSYRDRFEKVDEDLDKTFQSLQEGLENYSTNLRTFHTSLDGQFGKAVESLGALVKGLGDQVDELVDAASRKN
jgi:ABC-type transporter Mla subunit MlaD